MLIELQHVLGGDFYDLDPLLAHLWHCFSHICVSFHGGKNAHTAPLLNLQCLARWTVILCTYFSDWLFSKNGVHTHISTNNGT